MTTPHDGPPCRDPFDDLLDAVVSGDLTENEIALLNDTLRADPEARQAYIRTMALEAMIAREFAPPEETATPAATRANRWRQLAAIAATILLAATLAWQIRPSPNPGAADTAADADEPFTHAVITSLDEASGQFGGIALTQGMRLAEGPLQLDRGLLEITFDSGAELTLEGPARLFLESDNKSRLDAGRASAIVPEQARGFVIHTPSSYIRDLGTAFAVEVRDARETDLHVLEGVVEVAATGRSSAQPFTTLRQSEAVRLADGKMSPIRFRADHPGAKRRKHPAKVPPSLHWSFDSWDHATTTDPTRGNPLELLRSNGPATPAIIDGPFGNALHFDGHGTFARADDSGIGVAPARTVALWLRLQPETATPTPDATGIIAWSARRTPANWQIAWNADPNQGTLGAPRVEVGDGFVIGSTDLRDGRWHHLAVVCYGGAKRNIASHVRIYTDGHLEPLTGRHGRRNDPAPPRPLTIGCYHGRETGAFEGDLDEVHLFDGALLPGQITRLMKHNNLRANKGL